MTDTPGDLGNPFADFVDRYERDRERDRKHLRKLYCWMIVAVLVAPMIGVIVDRKYFRVGVPPPLRISRIVFAIDETMYTNDTRKLTLTIGNTGSGPSRGLEAWIEFPIGVRATAATGDPRVSVFLQDTNRLGGTESKKAYDLIRPNGEA